MKMDFRKCRNDMRLYFFLLICSYTFHMQAQIKYLALGDSYSIGEGVEEKDRWPVQLSAQLKGQGIEFDDVDIIARTGWTTDELLDAINDKLPAKDYDLVSLLIGVNNQYRGYPIEQYKEEFLRLLRIAIQCAKNNPSKVFVLSIPDYGVTPFAQTKDSKRIATRDR